MTSLENIAKIFILLLIYYNSRSVKDRYFISKSVIIWESVQNRKNIFKSSNNTVMICS